MGKLARAHLHTAKPKGPLATTTPAPTAEGGAGYGKDPKTELFTLAVANFVSEETFYESGRRRDERFEQLVRHVTQIDPAWMQGFIPWLRAEANMRSASIVAAVTYVAVGGPNGRTVISKACQRADEPAEALAYWIGTYGRTMPYALKRGIADAAVRLYSERSLVKYDSTGTSMRFGDVIDLTHPKAKAPWQSALFRYALDVRHKRADPRGLPELLELTEFLAWREHPTLEHLPKLATWENVSSHIKPDAAFWEALIPQMGYMALLRNLRNFEEAKISKLHTQIVAERLADPEEVANSRQLPFRFWSAWKHSGSMAFGPAIEAALDLSVGNIPEFQGRSLIMVDTSGSMQSPMSAKGKIARVEAAGLFGASVAARSTKDSCLSIYADGVAGIKVMPSTLRNTESIVASVGKVGHGTATWQMTRFVWDHEGPFERVLIFTDAQHHPGPHVDEFIPAHVPVYVWDLAGYTAAGLEAGRGRYLLGGLSDQSFKLVHMLERGKDASWPWETRPAPSWEPPTVPDGLASPP